MALLSPQQIGVAGTTVTFAASSATGETVAPDDRVWLEYKNATGGNINVVLTVPGSAYGQARPDVTVVVPLTTGHVRIGPMVQDLADPTTGLITASCGATTLTVAAVRI